MRACLCALCCAELVYIVPIVGSEHLSVPCSACLPLASHTVNWNCTLPGMEWKTHQMAIRHRTAFLAATPNER
jgi:hypothetical protein